MQSRMGNKVKLGTSDVNLGSSVWKNVDEVSRLFKFKYLRGSQSGFLELGTGSKHTEIIRIEVRAGTVGRQPHSQEEGSQMPD